MPSSAVVVAFGQLIRPHVLARCRWSTSTSRCCRDGGAPLRSNGRCWPAIDVTGRLPDAGRATGSTRAVCTPGRSRGDRCRSHCGRAAGGAGWASGRGCSSTRCRPARGRPSGNGASRCYAAKITPAELRIDWSRPAADSIGWCRLGGAWTTFRRGEDRITHESSGPERSLADGIDRLVRVGRAARGPARDGVRRMGRGTRPRPVSGSDDMPNSHRHRPLGRLRRAAPDRERRRLRQPRAAGAPRARATPGDRRSSPTSCTARPACGERATRSSTASSFRLPSRPRTLLRLGAYQLLFAGVPPTPRSAPPSLWRPRGCGGSSTRSCEDRLRHRSDGRRRDPAQLPRLDRRAGCAPSSAARRDRGAGADERAAVGHHARRRLRAGSLVAMGRGGGRRAAGERVLDVCAAPGGKSTTLAAPVRMWWRADIRLARTGLVAPTRIVSAVGVDGRGRRAGRRSARERSTRC